MVGVETEYIATGGNRHPSASDWDSVSGLLAFGADSNIALWNPLGQGHIGIHALLAGHSDKVNAVKFFPTATAKDRILISGSVDRTLQIWCSDDTSPVGFSSAATLTDHTNSINAIAVCAGSPIFVSGSADASIKIWSLRLSEVERIEIKLLQSITLKPRFIPLAIALSNLGTSESFVLAVAGTKNILLIYAGENTRQGPDCRLQATLTGHEGWIRSLAFTQERKGDCCDLILASASQDKYIRLWRIHQGRELPGANCFSKNSGLGQFDSPLSNKAHRFAIFGVPHSVTFEALLLGHEDWIYSASWRSTGKHLQLLSASADNSLAIWEQDVQSGLWVCIARLGELSAQKGATTATGSTGGFWTGHWSPDGTTVVCLGRTGSWRLWKYDAFQDRWMQGTAVSGHVKAVTSLSWAKNGKYLLSASLDQTTRLHAGWRRGSGLSWHEFARPQIHGYDLNCISALGASQFVSGADEKLLRVFDEPRGIADMLETLCGIPHPDSQSMPDAAHIPVLGLSNKAIQVTVEGSAPGAVEDEGTLVDAATNLTASAYSQNDPPLEDYLSRQTLWPESEKLYGHGYEISALACSNDHTLIATACRASSSDHAVIRLYETRDWREIKPALTAHSLTVTRLAFSEDDRYLLSVGRDRQWAIFERDEASETTYNPWKSNPKGHSRMILDAGWAPVEAGGLTFVTAGRDKTIKIWSVVGEDVVCKTTIPSLHAATAVEFLPRLVDHSIYVAVGTEAGLISIFGLETKVFSTVSSHTFDPRITPSRAITQLSWRPSAPETSTVGADGSRCDQGNMAYLAVASEDSSLRLYRISNL
ncbi:MAG: hypothetical protein M1835_006918 [Candelina submexicana]|nr:MAG: hypothetical protein M1835_006918 [Candelina submexicana]